MSKHAIPTSAKAPAVGNSVKSDLNIEIETLLDTISTQLPAAHLCQNCGFEMINIEVLFFLANNRRSWNIPMPICTKCNPEKYLKFMSRQAT